jgi:hypothetical protein
MSNFANPHRGVQLDPKELMERARSATGLTDFGDPWFERPLDRLIEFINAESGLVSADAMPVQIVIGGLCDRLKRVEYLKRHPEVRNERITVAGMIIGLPRGGSTLLQRLLTSSAQVTSTYWWELLNPLPLPGERPGDPSPRQEFAKGMAAEMHKLWPDMVSMHPLEPLGYDEEVQLIERSFLCIMYPFYFYIPSYVGWEMEQDHSKAYEELKQWLQILQFQDRSRRGRPWLLKSPHHLLGGGLENALSTFPDAKVLMTHRAIEDVIASFCSLQGTLIRPVSSTFDQRKLGHQAIEWFSRGIHKLIEVRKRTSPERFVDVQYKAMMSEPLVQFRRVFGLMGLTVRPEDERAAQNWMAEHPRDTHPRHRYAPEDYGVTRAEIGVAFEFYRRAFLET